MYMDIVLAFVLSISVGLITVSVAGVFPFRSGARIRMPKGKAWKGILDEMNWLDN
jgi:hypothetical protein